MVATEAFVSRGMTCVDLNFRKICWAEVGRNQKGDSLGRRHHMGGWGGCGRIRRRGTSELRQEQQRRKSEQSGDLKKKTQDSVTGGGEWMVGPQTEMGTQEEEQVGTMERAGSAESTVNLKCLGNIGQK